MLGIGWWLVAVLPNSKYAGNPADRGVTSGDNKLPLGPDVDPIASPSHRNNFSIKNMIRFLYISFLDSIRYEMLRWGLLESYGVMWTNNSARDSRVNDPPVVMQIDSASAYKPVNLVYTTHNNEYMQTNTNPTDIKNRTKHM